MTHKQKVSNRQGEGRGVCVSSAQGEPEISSLRTHDGTAAVCACVGGQRTGAVANTYNGDSTPVLGALTTHKHHRATGASGATRSPTGQ